MVLTTPTLHSKLPRIHSSVICKEREGGREEGGWEREREKEGGRERRGRKGEGGRKREGERRGGRIWILWCYILSYYAKMNVLGSRLQWNPAYNRYTTTADTHDIMDNSKSPNCPFIHSNT